MLNKISSDDPFRLLRGNNHQLCLQIAALTISQDFAGNYRQAGEIL